MTSDEDDRDPSAQDQGDPDRLAILARRRRFIAIAISGLATTACKPSAQPCLSIANPDADSGSDPDQPFVEDPGQPIEPSETGETGEPPEPNRPQVCLEVMPKSQPQPCLKKKPSAQPCLNFSNQS